MRRPDDWLQHVVRVYWKGRWPPMGTLWGSPRPCALCGRDLDDTGTVPPESLHPCPPCGGWHHVHNACVDDGDLVAREPGCYSAAGLREHGPLAVCPEALRTAEALMGGGA